MKITSLTAAAGLAVALIPAIAVAQSDRPQLHINTRWKECSFQLDPDLSAAEWKQFTREAGLVAYFRPLTDARPMGKGAFEVSLLQWKTGIDDREGAWNDTFVHPDADHWLFEGGGRRRRAKLNPHAFRHTIARRMRPPKQKSSRTVRSADREGQRALVVRRFRAGRRGASTRFSSRRTASASQWRMSV